MIKSSALVLQVSVQLLTHSTCFTFSYIYTKTFASSRNIIQISTPYFRPHSNKKENRHENYYSSSYVFKGVAHRLSRDIIILIVTQLMIAASRPRSRYCRSSSGDFVCRFTVEQDLKVHVVANNLFEYHESYSCWWRFRRDLKHVKNSSETSDKRWFSNHIFRLMV